MKLYYSPGACSLATHIALHEAGQTFEALAAPTKTHQLADGTDYYTINPLGYVPLIVLDDGRTLREVPALLQYIADLAPAKNLAPANGSFERYKLQEWLGFISVEVHKNFSPLFNPASTPEVKQATKERLLGRLKFVDEALAGHSYLMGDQFTVADIYLFVTTNWAALVGVDISGFANLLGLRERVGARAAVQAAMKAEGLIK